jgi:hypothetical protein
MVENSVCHDKTVVTAMQQIADWLKKLGLSEYAPCFVENGISVAALPHLTDQDSRKSASCLGIGG